MHRCRAATEGRLRSDHGFVPSIEISGASGVPLNSATNRGRTVWILDIDIGVSGPSTSGRGMLLARASE